MNGRGGRGIVEVLAAACGVWLVALGLYFMFLRPALLPEDLRYMRMQAGALQVALPGLVAWLGKVFTVLGGFMVGAGVLIAYVGWNVMPLRPRGAAITLASSGAATLVVMSAVNFALHSDFRWLLSLPALAWAGAVAAYLLGRPSPGHGHRR